MAHPYVSRKRTQHREDRIFRFVSRINHHRSISVKKLGIDRSYIATIDRGKSNRFSNRFSETFHGHFTHIIIRWISFDLSIEARLIKKKKKRKNTRIRRNFFLMRMKFSQSRIVYTCVNVSFFFFFFFYIDYSSFTTQFFSVTRRQNWKHILQTLLDLFNNP